MRFSLAIVPAALLGMLLIAGDADAQRRGRGGPIPGDVGRYVNPILNQGGYNQGGYYNDGRYYNDGSYYNDGYYNNYPNNYRTYYYYPPVNQTQYQAQYPSYSYDEDAGSKAWVTVRVPAQAEVFINGDKTDQAGMTREFISPALDKAGKYQITARWMQNGQQVERKKEVRVEPGRRSTVDFLADAREEAIAPDDVNRAKPKETLKPPDRQPKPRDNKAPDQDN